MCVYGPFLILGPRSLQKEWDGICGGCSTIRVALLERWSRGGRVEVWDELNGAVWSGLVRTGKMEQVDCFWIKGSHDLKSMIKRSKIKGPCSSKWLCALFLLFWNG